MIIGQASVVAVGRRGVATVAKRRRGAVHCVLDAITIGVGAVHNAVLVDIGAIAAIFNNVVDVVVIAVQILKVRGTVGTSV